MPDLLYDLVLYDGENPNAAELAALIKQDCKTRPDLIVVAGTTLSVAPVRSLVSVLSRNNRLILINQDWPCEASKVGRHFDFFIKGSLDTFSEIFSPYLREKEG
jgi:NAD-dependent SIR2 family protein deacetylase